MTSSESPVDYSHVRTVVDDGTLLGECPVWSAAENVLYWEDIDGKRVHRYDPATGQDEVRSTPGRPGSFVLTNSPGTLVVAMEHELVWLDWASGEVSPFVPVEAAGTGNRLNDGRCDHGGRFVVGSMYENPSDQKSNGVLHSIDQSGTVTDLRENIGVTNGIAFDPLYNRMYFADSFTRKVIVWDYHTATGARSNERVFADYGDLPGLPDGACVDSEGFYWSASVYGWALTRFNPDGEVDRRIEVPVQKPSMPAFGGPDLKTIYITTIGNAGDTASESGRDGFTPGALLAVDSDIAGISEPTFPLDS